MSPLARWRAVGSSKSPLPCAQPGDALFFSLHIPHYSPPNRTASPRTAVYITYAGKSKASEDEKVRYYEMYRRKMPPAGEQQPDEDYQEGHSVYSWATPMLKKQPGAHEA